MDPIAECNYKKDSTLAMLWAAADRGWSLHYMEQGDLYLDQGEPRAFACDLTVYQNPAKWYDLGERRSLRLEEMDVILMRKDPPFNNEYIYSSYMLEAAEARGSLIVNRPASLRDCNEKVFATHFPQCCPEVLVTRDEHLLREFHQQHGDVIFKPLDGMGGSAVFRLKPDDPNVGVIIEILTRHGAETIMAQRYLPEISAGDKRILMIDGEPVPYALARLPLAGETRGNLAAGGAGVPVELSERDRWIASQLGPSLRERGLIFVGLDVIGDYLTEVNVTSPTCIREIDAGCGTDIAGDLMTAIEGHLAARNKG